MTEDLRLLLSVEFIMVLPSVVSLAMRLVIGVFHL